MIQFVATGAPRSGTMWTSKALTQSGLECGHEEICSCWGPYYDDDRVWRHATVLGESSPQAGAFVDDMHDAGVVVVRVMRHPLAVIASMLARGLIGGRKPIERFYETHVPGPWTLWESWDDLPNVALLFWIEWNHRVGKVADLSWKTPATRHDIHDLGDLLDMKVHTQHVPSLPPANVGEHVTRLGPNSFDQSLWMQAMDLWETS